MTDDEVGRQAGRPLSASFPTKQLGSVRAYLCRQIPLAARREEPFKNISPRHSPGDRSDQRDGQYTC